ncbi:hypothetical protein EDD11_009831 [Mortierella claussenii]|nr:hypothetical protein EDD11_009831 [Mortierella claussenii]
MATGDAGSPQPQSQPQPPPSLPTDISGALQETTASAGSQSKPKVYLVGTEALVWNIQDVRQLRQVHRIVGSLSGALPRSPMQNIFQGLPLRLLPEEVFALWSCGLVDLIRDDPDSYRVSPPSSFDSAMTNTTTTAQTSSSSSSSATTFTSSHKPGSELITLHTQSIHLPPCTFSPHLQQYHKVLTTAASNTPEIPTLVPVPTARHIIFRHLWTDHQFFLAPGMKFGGDYLVYRKDPLICHASLIATVKEDPHEPLPLLDLVSKARLASTVQKQHLLCAVAEEDTTRAIKTSDASKNSSSSSSSSNSGSGGSKIMMFTVEWAGF